MRDPNGHGRAFFWDPNQGRCILPTLGGERARAWGINNHGQVVGEAETASSVSHAFVWDANNGIRDLTPSSTVKTRAFSINDAGQIIVFAQNSPILFDINKGESPTSPSIPFLGLIEINNKGFIAGVVRTGPDKFDIGIWHPDSDMTKFLQLNMDWPGTSTKINDDNQVVFAKTRRAIKLFGRTLFPPGARNYLEDPKRGRISLNKYVSIGEGEEFCLTDINNKGCIIGAVQSTKDSRSRGVLLEPIPEKWNK